VPVLGPPPAPTATAPSSASASAAPSARSVAPPSALRMRARVSRFADVVFSVPEARWAVAATVLFALGALAQLAGAPDWVFWGLYLACYGTGGWEPTLAGLQALRQKSLDVDLLMVVAAIAAASIGQVFDGALLIVIFATSGALEAIATRRTQDSVRALLRLAPERAVLLDDSGGERVVDAADLVPADHVLVRPGERIGADGTVTDGLSDVDQATITGEPLPVTKAVGDDVYAGTLNGTGALTVRVDRPAAESVVARIVAQVEQASSTKANTQLFIEKIEQRYSVGVVIATLLLLAVPLALGAAFQPTLLRAMTFMIVASPCAVVLATMPPLLAAMANAGRHGILVKSAVALEQLSNVDQVAFDKTGTLTLGTPRVADLATFGTDEDDIWTLAAAAEQPSEHPVGRAVVAAARTRNLTLSAPTEFAAVPGRGVHAVVDGRHVEVGSPRLLDTQAGSATPVPTSPAEAVARFESVGHTAIVVLIDHVPAAVIGLADQPRKEAAHAVRELTALTGRSPILLTGDNDAAARTLARPLGITDIRAGLLPEDKATVVAELQANGRRVGLVGDGINDAPAMATAHTGIAMGRTGSDLAMETSDAVLVRDDLTTLSSAIALAQRAERIVKANLAFAATVIAILVTWDIVGTLPLPLGVAGHEGSTIVVALNGLRLLRNKAWPSAQSPH
jgi:heavy metal translocating P-type ATPase